MPYLASQDDYGNTAIRPGALFFFTPLEGPVQSGKYLLSEYGFRYSLEQTLTFVSMSDVMKGDSDLGYYTFDFKSKWALFNAPDAGTAGWISSQVEAKNGLESAGNTHIRQIQSRHRDRSHRHLVGRERFPGAGTGVATIRAPWRNRRGRGHGQPAQLHPTATPMPTAVAASS